MLEGHADDNDALYDVPQAVPLLEDVADPCLLVRRARPTAPTPYGERTDGCATRYR